MPSAFICRALAPAASVADGWTAAAILEIANMTAFPRVTGGPTAAPGGGLGVRSCRGLLYPIGHAGGKNERPSSVREAEPRGRASPGGAWVRGKGGLRSPPGVRPGRRSLRAVRPQAEPGYERVGHARGPFRAAVPARAGGRGGLLRPAGPLPGR